MSKIKNLDDLREMVLDTLESLSSNKIDMQQAGIIAKLSETIVSGLKTQMEYARLTDEKPLIPFISRCSRVIEHEGNVKQLVKKENKNHGGRR